MSGEGFLSRWSRRKRGLEPEAPAPDAPPFAPAAEGGAAPAEPAFDPASLPPLEELGPQSDFSLFLRPQVPPLLRQAALRRMWSLDPVIRDFTGPADYAWDFNAPDGVPGFATSLSEELGRRLAQALSGLPAPDAGTPEEAAGEPPGLAAASEAPPLPESPLRLSPAEPAAAALPLPGTLAAGEAAAGEIPPGVPAHGEPAHGAPAQADPVSGPRRRHGGAMPS